MDLHQKKAGVSKLKFRDAISQKAREKNAELGLEFYSENPDDYVFLGKMESQSHQIVLFYCKKCQSTLAIDAPEEMR